MDLGLRDRVYIVTGGTRGLGRAGAEALVADGARVVVSSRNRESVERAVGELGGRSVAAGVAADNADPDTPTRLIDAARQHFGRLDGALISVGGPPGGDITDVPDDQWQSAFESVVLGAVRLARTIADELEEEGSLAFVLSSSVRSPLPGIAISNGLRPGLAMAAKTLSDELGPRGIRVNGLLPGRTATDRVQELDDAAGDPERIRAQRESGIPLRRYGQPNEVGRVAAFVLSPAASYMTGSMVTVDGGAIRSL